MIVSVSPFLMGFYPKKKKNLTVPNLIISFYTCSEVISNGHLIYLVILYLFFDRTLNYQYFFLVTKWLPTKKTGEYSQFTSSLVEILATDYTNE